MIIALSYGGSSAKLEEAKATSSKINILAACTLVFSTAFATTAFAVSFWQQCLIRMVMGLTQSMITPFSIGIISDLFPQEVRGSALR